ncbi:hypothetical protein C8Q73DRAFT_376724 [Cubamyces lactineus]|nr:hypothetical protein C8Q73DRAFT_376724 [Cubamyces lactineus]
MVRDTHRRTTRTFSLRYPRQQLAAIDKLAQRCAPSAFFRSKLQLSILSHRRFRNESSASLLCLAAMVYHRPCRWRPEYTLDPIQRTPVSVAMRTHHAHMAGWKISLFAGCIFWGNGPLDTPLQQYSNVTGNSVTWDTNVTAGLPIVFILNDSAGNGYESAPLAVQIGSDQSCLNDDSSSTDTDTTTSTEAGALTSTTPTPLGTNYGTTGSRQSTSTATPEPTKNMTKTGPSQTVALIAGVAVGGTAGVVLVLVGALLLRKRIARKRCHDIRPHTLRISPEPLDQMNPPLIMPEKYAGIEGEQFSDRSDVPSLT